MGNDLALFGTDRVLADIHHERKRQVVVEGFGRSADDDQPTGRLALASAAYAVHWSQFTAAAEEARLMPPQVKEFAEAISQNDPPDFWPLAAAWWKPHNDRSDLLRAAALLVAEIERMDRKAAPADATLLMHATQAGAEATAAKAIPRGVLLRSDGNPLLDALSWLRGIKNPGDNGTNLQLTISFLESLIQRLPPRANVEGAS